MLSSHQPFPARYRLDRDTWCGFHIGRLIRRHNASLNSKKLKKLRKASLLVDFIDLFYFLAIKLFDTYDLNNIYFDGMFTTYYKRDI